MSERKVGSSGQVSGDPAEPTAGETCLLCARPVRVGVLCREHADGIDACEQLTGEQIQVRSPVTSEAWLVDQWGIPYGIVSPTPIGRAPGGREIAARAPGGREIASGSSSESPVQGSAAGERAMGVRVLHPSVSALHARLERREDDWYVVDCASLNGTFVNRVQVVEALLSDGDQLAFGSVHFYFTSSASTPVTRNLQERGGTVRLQRDRLGVTITLALPDDRTLELTQKVDRGVGRVGDATAEFTALEFSLIKHLIERSRQHTDSEMAYMTWQELSRVLAFKSRAADSENVRELVRRARRKLKRLGVPDLIESRQRVGYRLQPGIRSRG